MIPRFGIDRFLNICSASGPSFSPDGRFLAFLYNGTGLSQVWQVPVEGGWPTQLTFADDGFIDYFGRPWAQNWEEHFEKGWERPEK